MMGDTPDISSFLMKTTAAPNDSKFVSATINELIGLIDNIIRVDLNPG